MGSVEDNSTEEPDGGGGSGLVIRGSFPNYQQRLMDLLGIDPPEGLAASGEFVNELGAAKALSQILQESGLMAQQGMAELAGEHTPGESASAGDAAGDVASIAHVLDASGAMIGAILDEEALLASLGKDGKTTIPGESERRQMAQTVMLSSLNIRDARVLIASILTYALGQDAQSADLETAQIHYEDDHIGAIMMMIVDMSEQELEELFASFDLHFADLPADCDLRLCFFRMFEAIAVAYHDHFSDESEWYVTVDNYFQSTMQTLGEYDVAPEDVEDDRAEPGYDEAQDVYLTEAREFAEPVVSIRMPEYAFKYDDEDFGPPRDLDEIAEAADEDHEIYKSMQERLLRLGEPEEDDETDPENPDDGEDWTGDPDEAEDDDIDAAADDDQDTNTTEEPVDRPESSEDASIGFGIWHATGRIIRRIDEKNDNKLEHQVDVAACLRDFVNSAMAFAPLMGKSVVEATDRVARSGGFELATDVAGVSSSLLLTSTGDQKDDTFDPDTEEL